MPSQQKTSVQTSSFSDVLDLEADPELLAKGGGAERPSGFRVFGFRVLGFRVLGFRVYGLGFRV